MITGNVITWFTQHHPRVVNNTTTAAQLASTVRGAVRGTLRLNEHLSYKRGVAGPKKWRPEIIIPKKLLSFLAHKPAF